MIPLTVTIRIGTRFSLTLTLWLPIM